jgi:uncharacterized membrane protein SpoIIM required for sporulation/uncharacterized RDD family membrane protein YckC
MCGGLLHVGSHYVYYAMVTHTPPPSLDRRVEVETPEHVVVGYALADLGSRFVALLLDGLIIVSSLLVFVIGVPLLAYALGLSGAGLLPLWMVLITIAGFVFTWGYFVYFEGFRGGQTPGKRRMGIRVVRDGGYPLDARGAVVRNLLRVLDAQPFPTWLVGGTVMLFHAETKRLGDLAAGSLVVRERTATVLPEESNISGEAAGPPRLSEAEWDALSRYAARHPDLALGVRRRIAGVLAARLGATEGDAEGAVLRLHRDEAARRSASATGGGGRAAALVRRQRARWDAFRRALQQAEREGLEALPEREVGSFAALYREVAADLARARTYGASPELLYTLERQVGAGHNLLYRPARRGWRQAWTWVAEGFPALVRSRWRPIALAAAFLYVPALIAFAAIRLDPPRAREVLPAELIARAEQASEREAAGKGYVEIPEVFMPVMASGIIANNVQVTFVAFAGGILAGIGTVLALVFNGVLLGGVAAAFANQGQSLHLWTFVLPHGIIELMAIAIAGGAGLWLGSALWMPGRRTRREALTMRGREAVGLIAGTTLLLIVAGMIEGFVSPAAIPRAVKLGFALLTAVLLALYLLSGGRATTDRAA